MSDVMIQAQDLTKVYGTFRALDRVSFEVRRGEVLGFLGPNGAGKTTTMKILTCFIAPSDGTAKVNCADVFDNPLGARAAVGYLPESTPLYTEMMVVEYLEFIAKMRGFSGEEARKRIRRAVEQTGLGDVFAKEIRALSKGYKQRVGLAQALVHEPPILILDEPMSGLDPNQAVEIRDLITAIGKERTVVLSTHNLAEVQVACQRVLIIAKGRIVADDTPKALQDRAGKPRVIATFLKPEGGAGLVEDALRALGGVNTVRPLPGANEGEATFELVPSHDDVRAEVFRLAVQRDFVLLEMRREGQNLEQIFRELTVGDGKAEARTKSASPASEEKGA